MNVENIYSRCKRIWYGFHTQTHTHGCLSKKRVEAYSASYGSFCWKLQQINSNTLKSDGLKTQSRPLKISSSGLNVGSSDILPISSLYSKPNSDSSSRKNTVSKFSSKPSSKSKSKVSQSNKIKEFKIQQNQVVQNQICPGAQNQSK